MSEYPMWYSILAGLLGGILGGGLGIYIYANHQGTVNRILDATVGKLLDRFNL